MDQAQVLTLIGVAIANIGTTITLFLWSTARTDEGRRETNAVLQGIHEEMKDFHGRLCSIEERARIKVYEGK